MTQYSFMPKENLEDLARKLGLGPYTPKQSGIVKPAKVQKKFEKEEFGIDETDDSYVIRGVKYEGQIVTVAWDKELLDNGESHTQDDWINLTDKLPDATVYHATLSALFANKKGTYAKLIKKIEKMFKKDFDNNWVMTSTRIKYKPKNKDDIIHNYGSQQPRIIKVSLTGPNTFIDDQSGLEKQIEAVLGTNDIKEIQKIYSWIGDKPYLWRLNSKPQQTDQRAVVLGRNIFSRFNINCSDDIDDGWPVRGVVVVGRAEKAS